VFDLVSALVMVLHDATSLAAIWTFSLCFILRQRGGRCVGPVFLLFGHCAYSSWRRFFVIDGCSRPLVVVLSKVLVSLETPRVSNKDLKTSVNGENRGQTQTNLPTLCSRDFCLRFLGGCAADGIL
jgi:hypothetical protein